MHKDLVDDLTLIAAHRQCPAKTVFRSDREFVQTEIARSVINLHFQ